MEKVMIQQKSRTYDVKLGYHSDLMCENYDAEILAIQESDGRITFSPKDKYEDSFTFKHSDPDRVIAIANMILSFAQMVKNKNNKPIDTDDNE